MSTPGVLLINLGSPDSTRVSDVCTYLGEFLMDGRVLDVVYPVRWCIVHLAILPKRPAQSAEAYEKIWTPEGSPLVVTSRNMAEGLQRRLNCPVELAMRYRNPSAEAALTRLREKKVTDTVVLPLFPHYAMSSFETAVVHVRETAARVAPEMRLRVAPPYFDHPAYIRALVASAQPFLESGFDHLLFSYHGIPERHLRKSDPTGQHCLSRPDCCETPSPAHATCYRAQCFATTRAFVALAGISQDKYGVSFQSRLGRDPWLKPYTDFVIPELAERGVKKLLVICPAFVADCLETLEEISMRAKESFLSCGGSK